MGYRGEDTGEEGGGVEEGVGMDLLLLPLGVPVGGFCQGLEAI